MAAARVIVVGGGFGGLEVVRALAHAAASVVVVDRHNYHLFQPLLYQVAAAVLSPADIAQPIRAILRDQANVTVMLAQATGVDLARRTVTLRREDEPPSTLAYDWLVLACGATHSYFGHNRWADDAPGLKTIDDAIEIRRRVLLAFEEAEHEGDAASRRRKLTFVVIGGGPTGVELAGAIQEIAARSIARDFRNIDTTTTRVILIEAGERLLPAMAPELGERARRDLEAMGVEVMLRSTVTDLDRHHVWMGPERIATENVLWAAGVRAAPLGASLGVPLDRSGRVQVGAALAVPGRPEVFAIGDLAAVVDPATGRLVPGVAPAAQQMGRFVGRVIRDAVAGTTGPRPAFQYRDKGTMATIGRNRAVAQVGRLRLTGFVAWLAWSVVHVAFLVGFRNKLMVLLGWAWNYVLWRKGARLITGDRALAADQAQARTGAAPVS